MSYRITARHTVAERQRAVVRPQNPRAGPVDRTRSAFESTGARGQPLSLSTGAAKLHLPDPCPKTERTWQHANRVLAWHIDTPQGLLERVGGLTAAGRRGQNAVLQLDPADPNAACRRSDHEKPPGAAARPTRARRAMEVRNGQGTMLMTARPEVSLTPFRGRMPAVSPRRADTGGSGDRSGGSSGDHTYALAAEVATRTNYSTNGGCRHADIDVDWLIRCLKGPESGDAGDAGGGGSSRSHASAALGAGPAAATSAGAERSIAGLVVNRNDSARSLADMLVRRLRSRVYSSDRSGCSGGSGRRARRPLTTSEAGKLAATATRGYPKTERAVFPTQLTLL